MFYLVIFNQDFLSNIISCCHLLGGAGSALLSSFLAQTLALPPHKKARFSALSCLIKAGGLENILAVNPRFREEILQMAEEYALVGPLTDLYENLVRADFRTHREEVGRWYSGSVRPLLHQLRSSENLGTSQLSRNLLNKCGKLYPGLVELIFKEEEDLGGKLALYCLR